MNEKEEDKYTKEYYKRLAEAKVSAGWDHIRSEDGTVHLQSNDGSYGVL